MTGETTWFSFNKDFLPCRGVINCKSLLGIETADNYDISVTVITDHFVCRRVHDNLLVADSVGGATLLIVHAETKGMDQFAHKVLL